MQSGYTIAGRQAEGRAQLFQRSLDVARPNEPAGTLDHHDGVREPQDLSGNRSAEVSPIPHDQVDWPAADQRDQVMCPCRTQAPDEVTANHCSFMLEVVRQERSSVRHQVWAGRHESETSLGDIALQRGSPRHGYLMPNSASPLGQREQRLQMPVPARRAEQHACH